MLSCAASAPKFCSAAPPGKTKPGGIVPQRHRESHCSGKRGVSSYARHSCWQSFINDRRQRACRGSRRRSKTSRASVLHTPLGRLATGSDCHSEIPLHVARLASLKCDFVHAKRHCWICYILAQVAGIVANYAAMLYQRRAAIPIVFTTSLDGNRCREMVAAVFLRRIRN
jgi:hypothetical protein